MGYSHLLASKAALADFRVAFGVPRDIDIAYYHEGNIALHRRFNPNVAFFLLMAILEGGVRLPVVPLGFMAFAPTNFPPIFTKL